MSQAATANAADQSLFSYLRKAGAELSSNSAPRNLESLSQMVAAISSFKYPAFQPVARDLLVRGGDSEWRKKLIEECEACPESKALGYLKRLSSCDIPDVILESLLRKVTIQTGQDVEAFCLVIRSLRPELVTTTLRGVVGRVVKRACHARMNLSTYLDLWETFRLHWETSRRLIIPTAVKTELVEAAWGALLRCDLTKESEFVDAIKWLCMCEQVPHQRPGEIAAFINQIEIRARTGQLSQKALMEVMCAVVGVRGDVVPEPIDSIAHLAIRRLKDVSSEMTALNSAVNKYLNRRVKPMQLEGIVNQLLPQLVEAVKSTVSSVPARALPDSLRLLNSVDPEVVESELARRGHEMDGVELVRIVNLLDHHLDPQVLVSLFRITLAEVAYLTGLFARLSLEDKVGWLSMLVPVMGEDAVRILLDGLSESIKADLAKEDNQLALFKSETLVKMAALGGDEIFAASTLVPSELLRAFLATPESLRLTNRQALLLMKTGGIEVKNKLFAQVLDSASLYELIELLAVASGNQGFVRQTLKRLVPRIDEMDGSRLVEVLGLVPVMSEVAGSGLGPRFSPTCQIEEVAVGKFAALVPGKDDDLSLDQVVAGFLHLGRLNFFSPDCAEAVVNRLLGSSGLLTKSSENCLQLVRACRQLGVYSGALLDRLVCEFLKDAPSVRLVEGFARSLLELGNRNDQMVRGVESALRTLVGDEPVIPASKLSEAISLLNILARWNVYSPLFHEEFRRVIESASGHISKISDEDWIRLFEINLSVVIEAPPKVKVKYVNNPSYKAFIDEHCAFAWYAHQDRQRSRFIHSSHRAELVEAVRQAGWADATISGKEIYHLDLVSSDGKTAFVLIPESDELQFYNHRQEPLKVVVGDSLAKLKHLQVFGYKLVPVWMREWKRLRSVEERAQCITKNASQVVYSLGPGPFAE